MSIETCGDLANCLDAIRQPTPNEEALSELAAADLEVIAWVCRLISPQTIAVLRRNADSPLWGTDELGRPAPDPLRLAAPSRGGR